MRSFLFVFILISFMTLGCSPSNPPAVVSLPPDTSSLPRFDDLDYKNWKRFTVGTMVKRKSVTSSQSGTASTTSIETYTLKSLDEISCVVERQNTTERSDGSYKAVNHPEQRTYNRQFPIPEGMTADDFAKPSRNAKKSGEETLTVLGKEYKCMLYTWDNSTEAGKMKIQLWLSDEMPGRIVKQVMKVDSIKSSTIEEVVEVKTP